jgi:hypothetical protein
MFRIKFAVFVFCILAGCSSNDKSKVIWNDNIKVVLDNTTLLKYDRGNRLPLYLWPAISPGELNDASAEKLVSELDKRGIGLVCSWDFKDTSKILSYSFLLPGHRKSWESSSTLRLPT